MYRTNAQSLGFETEFLRRGIPYQIVGSLKFYEREEIKDALALLSFLVNPRDEVAFRRVVNKPARGLGAVTVDRLIEAGLSQGIDLLKTAKSMVNTLSPKAQKGLETFLKVMADGKALLDQPLAETENSLNNSEGDTDSPAKKKRQRKPKEGGALVAGEGLSVCVAQMLKNSGIAEHHMLEDEITGTQRLNNMQELVNAASLYAASVEGLLEFLEHIELDRSREEATAGESTEADNAQKVTLITFHNTKGLEFRKVIMTGLEQGVFPREDKKDEELEEERRLFYVGATRAMDELYLSSCAIRRMFGKTMPLEPSVFLREIDKSCLKILGNAPYSFRTGQNSAVPRRPHPWDRNETEAEQVSGWRRGQKLFHDDYGYGVVVEVRNGDTASDSNAGPVVRVQFETGKELRFLSEQKSSAFVKIGDDD
jgi:DNA helicase-2/ATP-dependent DNA helicase PcrA